MNEFVQRQIGHGAFESSILTLQLFEALGLIQFEPVHGEFLIMRPLVSETIPDNVPATQNALGLPVAVGLFQRLPLGFVEALLHNWPLMRDVLTMAHDTQSLYLPIPCS